MRVSDSDSRAFTSDFDGLYGTGSKRADGSDYAAPYQHQGTGTINALVLALLSLIAELKQNVIFAMEEPEMRFHLTLKSELSTVSARGQHKRCLRRTRLTC